MLLLTLGQSAENLVLTLNEKRTLTSGYYLFLFTHVTEKTVVSVIYNFTDDDSAYPDRYNQFEINTSTVFLLKPIGQWKYFVYEQASSTNTNPTGLTEVENGILVLKPAAVFSFETYNSPTTFKAYGG